MDPVLKKLQFKGQDPILIMGKPDEYDAVVRQIPSKIDATPKSLYQFIQLFVKTREELEAKIQDVIGALEGDGYLWICYPKGTAKRYSSDVNRDRIREIARKHHYEGVSLIALDDDWSALRIRNISFIMSRKPKAARCCRKVIGENRKHSRQFRSLS